MPLHLTDVSLYNTSMYQLQLHQWTTILMYHYINVPVTTTPMYHYTDVPLYQCTSHNYTNVSFTITPCTICMYLLQLH